MTVTPAAANAYAVAQPVRPPPTTTTSVLVAPRYRGWAGTRDFGNRSIHGDWPYLVGIGRTLYRGGMGGMGGTGIPSPRPAFGRGLGCCAMGVSSLPAFPAFPAFPAPPAPPARGASSCD